MEYYTLIAHYLPMEWRSAYYACPYLLPYNAYDLHYFPTDGLTLTAIEDLRERELSSYASIAISDPEASALLISDEFPELDVLLLRPSVLHKLQFALRDCLLETAKGRMKAGLLRRLKEGLEDDDSLHSYLHLRSQRQIAHDFSPYGSGDGALLPAVDGDHEC